MERTYTITMSSAARRAALNVMYVEVTKSRDALVAAFNSRDEDMIEARAAEFNAAYAAMVALENADGGDDEG